MNAVIGIDFGTQSARALMADADTGAALHSVSFPYPRGILRGDLVCIDDYHEALDALLSAMADTPWRGDVRGVCVDATSLTLVCVNKDGTPLGHLPGFAGREQAMVKLWKRHHAEPQARELLALAQQMNEPFLGRTGGTVSSEWTLPKLVEIRDEDPAVYGQIDLAFDLCEYLTYRLTGELVRSSGSMCYKGLWASDLTFPTDECLNRLRPGLAAEYKHFLRGPVLAPGQKAGRLRAELCQQYGFSPEVTVAVGTLDGHTAQVALGALHPGDAALVVGTSNVLSIQTRGLQEIPGVCGVAMDGQLPGLCGIDSGQSCTGDLLSWYMHSLLPASVRQEADAAQVSVHALLAARVTQPWRCPLTAADWWNGSRNTPCDLSLPGFIHGFTLKTRPEDVYLALLQAIVCGTREIIEQCEACGVPVTRCLATGGAAAKNPLLMQQYADILHRPVHVGNFAEGPALGAAIFAAVAAGLYADAAEACARMGVTGFAVYTPDEAHHDDYERIYRRSRMLRQTMHALNQTLNNL